MSESATADFVLTRVFDAPRDLVWKAFTEPERMKHWWGPRGTTTVTSKMDLRPGGTYHYAMQTPDGQVMWGKFVYRAIEAPQRIVFVNVFSDEAGGVTRHPMSPTWPLEILSSFTFDALPDGKTRLTIRWSPINATPQERQTFDTSHDSMRQGWGGSLDQLEAYLANSN